MKLNDLFRNSGPLKQCMNLLVLLLFVFTWAACKQQTNELERVLKLAGPNRIELEKVIDHYSQNKSDSLKLKAAMFLITNMDVHFSYKSKIWDAFQMEMDTLFNHEDRFAELEQELERLYEKYGTSLYADLSYDSDLQTISADFLIYNIDMAFEKWSGPYAFYLSFDDFCEYILPYRAGREPLTDWRSEFQENFIPSLYTRLPEGIDSISAIDYCNAIKTYPHGNLSIVGGKLPDYNAQTLSIMRMGNCRHYCAQAILAARHLGIPVCIDRTPQWATRSLGHEWNALIQKNGKPLSFGIGDNCELGEHVEFIPDRIPPKVYRQTFSKQKESLAIVCRNEDIPQSLSSPCMKDVTDEYYDCVDVSVKFDFKAPKKNKFAYLAVFDNEKWVPVCWARISNDEALFKNVNKNILCLPGYYNEKRFIPAASPFIIDSLGNVVHVELDLKSKQSMVLSRKYQNGLVNGNCKEMEGGRFQVANQADFSDAINIAEIKEKPDASYHIVATDIEGSYKYFRYIARPKSLGTIAELEVYESGSTEKLAGRIIGTEQTIPDFSKEKAFDGDPLTNFIKWESDEVWIGLEFDKPTQINKIVYLPGNDDNCIRDGELYELFYWDNEWISLGQQIGSSETYRLKYENAPVGALYLLRNHTKGVEERIFTYENNKQVWW